MGDFGFLLRSTIERYSIFDSSFGLFFFFCVEILLYLIVFINQDEQNANGCFSFFDDFQQNGHVGFMLSCYDAELSYDSHTDTFNAR